MWLVKDCSDPGLSGTPSRSHCQFTPFSVCYTIAGVRWNCVLSGSATARMRYDIGLGGGGGPGWLPEG